ncbi:hypothetical protein L9F63_007680 [Diploptera punctata]|uniref:Spaetzle domain-containing protein n=1 Tax=Diploptera punctata TaxID=6984 RepID=A0AAD7Z826_DIPPU|nr:hypothetical protein L9F63_007680 [Diploptera punctata]
MFVKGKILCDTVTNYPSRQVSTAVKAKGNNLKDFFVTEPPFAEKLQSRIGEREIELCPSRIETSYPKAGETNAGDKMYIVNNDEYKQGVSVEVCGNSGEKCKLSESFPTGYQAICQQKYSLKRMVGIDRNGESIVDHFKVPSCCVCSVTVQI